MKKILLTPDANAGGTPPAATSPAATPPASPAKPEVKKQGLIDVRANEDLHYDHNGTTYRHKKGETFAVNESRLATLKNKVTRLGVAVIAAFLLAMCLGTAQAQQISSAIIGPFVGPIGTNSPILRANTFTNLLVGNTNVMGAGSAIQTNGSNAIVTLTTYKSFELEVAWTPMNGASNEITLAWSSSMNGSNWPAQFGTNSANASWFKIMGADATNSAGVCYWHTNITPNANYWRAEFITNTANVVLSNVLVRVWKKPSNLGQ